MKFTSDQVRMIDQTLAVPLHAFGGDVLKKKIGDSTLEHVTRLTNSLRDTQEVSDADLSLFIRAFLISRFVIGESQYATLTGFSWEESLDFTLGIIKEMRKGNE